MKILTVDDSKVVRRIVSNVIALTGYEPVECADGVQALESLARHHEDTALIVLDWNMPAMDGFECLKQIRATDEFASIPVMMLTAESRRASVAAAIQAGANHYCTKPFTVESLAAKIMECLGLGE